MSTMNISLPEPMKKFVDEHVSAAGYGTSSEYLRELIRRDQDRLHLRGLIMQGAKSEIVSEPNAAFFNKLRVDVATRLTKTKV